MKKEKGKDEKGSGSHGFLEKMMLLEDVENDNTYIILLPQQRKEI